MDAVFVIADMLDLYPIFRTRTVKKLPARVSLGICYVAAKVREAGYSVFIIDNYLEEKPNRTVAEMILSRKPLVAGFSVTAMNARNTFEIAEAVKKATPGIKVVLGGPQATIAPLDLLSHSCVDYIVTGEGELSMPHLLGMLSGGDVSIASIPGLYYRDRNGEVHHTGPIAWLDDLDSLPLPARDLVEFERYNKRGETTGTSRVATLSTSRGCPYHCAFCASDYYFCKKYRYRSAANVVDEIEILIAEYRVDGLYFREDCFTVNRRRVVELCREMTRRKINLPWECEARVDNLDRELLQIMHDAGCRGLWCGIESGSPRILSYLQKGITVEQVRSAYRWTREIGINTGAGFIIGVPGETMEDAFMSLRLGKEINPGWAYFQSYVGYPRSKIYDEIVRDELYVGEVDKIYDVQTRELRRSEIRALENYFQKDFEHFLETRRVQQQPPKEPRGGWPSISVVVPARNAERSIEECLVSLVNQDYPKDKLEIIIVDNNSRDRTQEIICRFPVTLMEQKDKNSSYATRNAGLAHARGEIIAFTDSDCVAITGWLKNLVSGVENKQFGCFAGEVTPYRRESLIDDFLYDIKHMSHKKLLDYKPLPRAMTANLAFRRAVFEKIGLFDGETISGGDSEMLIRMITKMKLKVRYAPEAIVFHKHRTQPWPFFTQFVRYGWGEAKIVRDYADIYHTSLGIGIRYDLSEFLSAFKAFARYTISPRKGVDSLHRYGPVLQFIRLIAWEIGLRAGLVYWKGHSK